MSHQAQGSDSNSGEQHQELRSALSWLLKGADFTDVQWREDCSWSIRGLVMTTILAAWSGAGTLGSRFEQAVNVGRRMLGDEEVPEVSYQAWTKLLRRCTIPLLLALTAIFRRRMETEFADRWRISGWIPFGVDGSRFELPRTKANEYYFSPAKPSSAKSQQKRQQILAKRNDYHDYQSILTRLPHFAPHWPVLKRPMTNWPTTHCPSKCRLSIHPANSNCRSDCTTSPPHHCR